MMRKIFTGICVLLATAVSGELSAFAANSGEVARVGGKGFADSTVILRTKLYSGSKYNENDLRYVALAQLIRGELAVQLLEREGLKPNDQELETEAKRAEVKLQSAEGRELLKTFKAGGRKVYLDTFVLPGYAEKKLRNDVYPKADDARTDARQKAEALLRNLLARPAAFAEKAGKSGFKVQRLSASVGSGVFLYDGEKRTQISPPRSLKAKNLETALAAVKNGVLLSAVVEGPDCYLIVRMAGKEQGNLLADAILVPKNNFDNWFFARVARTPVTIKEPLLKREFLKNVAWASKLNMK